MSSSDCDNLDLMWEEMGLEFLDGDVDDSEEEHGDQELQISKERADLNYHEAGRLVNEECDQISIEKNHNLLSDQVHLKIMELLDEVALPQDFKLADFQLLSLHVLGSKKNLIIISPTGSGKMLVILLGTLLMRKIMKTPHGVAVGTQPLSIIMEEQLDNEIAPVAVMSMTGELKYRAASEDEEEEVALSAPEDEVLQGRYPCLIGHPESWASAQGQELVMKLHDKSMIIMNFVDELHQGLADHWQSFRP